jgi:hypothetical protein
MYERCAEVDKNCREKQFSEQTSDNGEAYREKTLANV